jgi:trehalose 6-phosphate phosphatase
MRAMAYQGAIFDVDGVLVDSPHELAWRESLQTLMETEWREVHDQTGWAPERFTPVVYQQVMSGKPRMAGARAALEHFGVPDVEARAEQYAAEHAAAPGVRYLGLYGLQEIRDGQVRVDPRLEDGRPAVEAARRKLREHPAVRDSGAFVEDKRYAVAVHTRRVTDPQRWAAPIDRAAREIAAGHGLEVVPGKLVWELRPAVPSDKGEAVRKVLIESGARAVLVAGDDLGDLSAFAAAAQLAAEGGDALRVAVASAETPERLLAEADLVVDGPPGLGDFLRRLAE